MAEHAAGGRGQVPAWIFVAVSLLGALGAVSLLPEVASGQKFRLAVPWLPSLGVRLSFFVDGLSLLFALLITGVGVFVGLYAGAYMRGHALAGRFFLYLLLFQASMVGLVLADNVVTLFVFWELTTVSSFLLIGFDNASEQARRNAWQALLVTGAGGPALLAGLLLLAAAGGSMELSELMKRGEEIRVHPLYTAILVLVLLGAFTKSAQFPFHFWLPNAMAAPTPVSAYLHSATMVKAGIYLLARLHPALAGTPEWIWTLTIVGAVTALWASTVALRQTDLKLTLAYTTVMALGTLTMFLGSEARIAIAAAVTFLLVHALYKCALFLVVGIVDHETGTREVDRLGGLARAMPVTAIAAVAAALSMSGFPPFLGFIGKELKYEGALAVASEPVLVAAASVAANAMMVAIAGIVVVRPFFGPAGAGLGEAHEPPLRMWLGPLTLASLGLVLGLMPPYAELLVQPAVSAVLGQPERVALALWHGFNLPLLLSVLTLTIGLGLYLWHRRLRARLAALMASLPVTGDGGYDRVKDAVLWVAKVQTALLQTGSLRRYLFVLFAVTAGAADATLLVEDGARWPADWPVLPIYDWGVVLLVAAGAVLPILARSRLAAICGLGAVGSGIALIFLLYGAPDVALTQLLVEVLFVVIIAVILLKLPRFVGQQHSGRGGRGRDIVLAVASGTVMTLLMLSLLDSPLSPHLTRFFEASSVPEAHGRNVVNVILVDFRALDTLGEIIVVAVAALGAFALIKLKARGSPSA
jgi:multicomponent Na+:H+ antiporter subunit A